MGWVAPKMPSYGAVASVLINLVFSISIILFNKMLFQTFRFGFAPTTLLVGHAATTWLGMWVLQRCGGFEASRLLPGLCAALSATAVSATVFANLSLKYNTVGSYQIIKLVTIPMTCLLESMWLGTRYSPQILTSLVVLLLGVGLATVTDVEFNVRGLLCGLAASGGVTAYGVVLKRVQREHSVGSSQLVTLLAPWNLLFSVLWIPATDDVRQLLHYPFTRLALVLLVATCLFAWGICYSFVLVVEKTSPLTMQVLGHFKTVLILVLGFMVFATPLSGQCLAGIGLALLGVGAYSYIKSQPQPTSATVATSPPPDNAEEEA
eukprot:TRINITY_DN7314_c0_g1_i1.p1 TRINITY_DN7314_c0_g1~~TRINITY_DN7314_c0_g1_i1.p1  ORF type:complete len:340 (+),score=151.98 TRINITY_DN7314_c0_g1_i1:60-1022(+)